MLIFQKPKTEFIKRTIPLSDNVLTEPKDHRKKQFEEKLKAGAFTKIMTLYFVKR